MIPSRYVGNPSKRVQPHKKKRNTFGYKSKNSDPKSEAEVSIALVSGQLGANLSKLTYLFPPKGVSPAKSLSPSKEETLSVPILKTNPKL